MNSLVTAVRSSDVTKSLRRAATVTASSESDARPIMISEAALRTTGASHLPVVQAGMPTGQFLDLGDWQPGSHRPFHRSLQFPGHPAGQANYAGGPPRQQVGHMAGYTQ